MSFYFVYYKSDSKCQTHWLDSTQRPKLMTITWMIVFFVWIFCYTVELRFSKEFIHTHTHTWWWWCWSHGFNIHKNKKEYKQDWKRYLKRDYVIPRKIFKRWIIQEKEKKMNQIPNGNHNLDIHYSSWVFFFTFFF